MAGLGTSRLMAYAEMINRERRFQRGWMDCRLRSDIPNSKVSESLSVETSVDWIGLNPDPCRYRLDYMDRRNLATDPGRTGPVEKLAHSHHPCIKEKSKATTSASEIGRATNLKPSFPPITYVEISGPTARGTVSRQFFTRNHSCIF
jgi:hypothetical protein